MTIIDCHVHLNHYEGTKYLPLEERKELLLHTMQDGNVDHSIILSSYKVNPDRPSTEQLIEISKKHDNLSVVAGFSIDGHNDDDFQDCRKWLKDGLIRGMKLYCGYEHYYPYDKRYQRVYDLCIEYDVPVMIHTGDTFSSKGKLKYSHPLNIDEIAVDNPELKIIICHIGNPWIQDCEEIIYKNKNAYADISGLVLGEFSHYFEDYMVDKVREFLNYAGEPRYLLYGSDWPLSSMDSYLNFAAKLELTQHSRELLMFRNAKSLFKI
ncbi:MAG: amidohydrolase [Thaumarchaeota archaeon 13_1_40CM_3_50_5]|nr:MAG: amidohydrolase [Candidatus Nitrososphaera sp. 13_1_40CM_48_12]OLC83196.1 MAG: amidohydrolase [Thaumarchaeota archaeon 13_1_40CM_3_50_5]TLY04575.1 MAG: amidohydrolase [Nitrososphaerota archaeon]TLY07487.1 MAG: amidohydrolase [Nitrososphaerota archaeon]TLY09350.1 MAG: amidohydrolase [Nitrososphaerota archaeon]